MVSQPQAGRGRRQRRDVYCHGISSLICPCSAERPGEVARSYSKRYFWGYCRGENFHITTGILHLTAACVTDEFIGIDPDSVGNGRRRRVHDIDAAGGDELV